MWKINNGNGFSTVSGPQTTAETAVNTPEEMGKSIKMRARWRSQKGALQISSFFPPTDVPPNPATYCARVWTHQWAKFSLFFLCSLWVSYRGISVVLGSLGHCVRAPGPGLEISILQGSSTSTKKTPTEQSNF